MNQQVSVQTSSAEVQVMATGSAFVSAITKGIYRLIAKLGMMRKTRADRAELDKLSPGILRDIGVDYVSVRRELERSYYPVAMHRQ